MKGKPGPTQPISDFLRQRKPDTSCRTEELLEQRNSLQPLIYRSITEKQCAVFHDTGTEAGRTGHDGEHVVHVRVEALLQTGLREEEECKSNGGEQQH